MALISQSDLEARLGRSLTADEVTDFSVVNEAIQTLVEKQLGSNVEEVVESTRYYDGGVQHLKIDPCTELTSVKIVDDDYSVVETVQTDDYTQEPKNRTLKHQVRFRYGRVYKGFNNIAVAAKFSIYGDTDALNIVKNAILDMLVQDLTQADSVKREAIDGYSVEYRDYKETSSMRALKTITPPLL